MENLQSQGDQLCAESQGSTGTWSSFVVSCSHILVTIDPVHCKLLTRSRTSAILIVYFDYSACVLEKRKSCCRYKSLFQACVCAFIDRWDVPLAAQPNRQLRSFARFVVRSLKADGASRLITTTYFRVNCLERSPYFDLSSADKISAVLFMSLQP